AIQRLDWFACARNDEVRRLTCILICAQPTQRLRHPAKKALLRLVVTSNTNTGQKPCTRCGV
ncbi:MAG: hypothetical protein WA858_27180, partial [Xanthobacteraceae bacterium]